MTSSPIGIVICRAGAVLLAVSAFRGLGFMIGPLLSGSGELEFFLMFAVMLVAPLASAFVLWHYAEQISAMPLLAPRTATIGDLDADELVGVGTHLIGIYVLVFGVVTLFGTEALAWAQSGMYEDSDSLRETVSPHTFGNRISYAVQIVLGLALLIRGKKGQRL